MLPRIPVASGFRYRHPPDSPSSSSVLKTKKGTQFQRALPSPTRTSSQQTQHFLIWSWELTERVRE